jgi:hypothetical protein
MAVSVPKFKSLESIYRRYAIVDEAMHQAAERLDAWSTDQRAKAAAEAERRDS